MSSIHVMTAFETTPPKQDFVIPGLVAGTVGALIAPGSTGKSMLALQMACAVASELPTANSTGLDIWEHGPVMYLNIEDPASEIHRRLFALGSRYDLVTRQSIADGLKIWSRLGQPTDIMNKRFYKALLKVAQGKRLLVIDTLSRAHALPENDNGAMSNLVSRLESVSRRTGAAVIFLHHTSKAAALNGQGDMQQAARGASALIDNARWCGNLTKMTKDEAEKLSVRTDCAPIGEEQRKYFVRYELGKQNYGEVESGQWYQRTGGGILAPITLVSVTKESRKKGGRDAM